ncbi:acyl carrier protein [Streptomyces sp. MB22_4]|uniref:acyl carrier protein n=1 Tax=Streptomyces sp. MB22_4 TaxID=3383120 RepID=UPI0039A00B25
MLALPEVGPDDAFFDLGGDSLRAMRMAARIQSELGDDFDVELLFDFSTVRELAAGIARITAAGN